MTRSRSLAGLAALAVFGGLLFWFRIGSGDLARYGLASGDAFLYFYPSYEQLYARVRQGVLPAWNPWQLFGTPWLATLQAGLYYPGHVAYLLLPTHTAMAVSAVAHVALAALGVYAFLRRVRVGQLGALAGALIFALRGYFLSCLGGPNLVEAAAWIGVGALGVVALVERPTARAGVLLAVATALSVLAGAPQHTAYLLYAWSSLWVARVVAARLPPAAVAQSAGVFAGALLLAALLAAAQLVPTAEIMRAASRSAAALPERVLSPIGNPARHVLGSVPIAGSPLSFGIAPLVLASVAALGGRHLGLLAWALALGTAAALFAWGSGTPWFAIYRALPGLGMFRGPERVLLLTDFALAVAAAIAIDGLVRGPDPAAVAIDGLVHGPDSASASSRRRRAALAGLSLTLAAGWTIWHAAHGTPAAGMLAVWLAAGALVWAFATRTGSPGGARGRRIRVVVAAAALVLTAAEIFVRTDLGVVLPYTAENVRWLEAYDPTYRYLALGAPHDRVWLLSMLDPRFAAKQATRHRLRNVEDYEPMNLTRQNRYLTFFGQGVVTDFVNDLPFIGYVPGGLAPGAEGTSSGTRRRLLDLAAVGRILVPTARLTEPRMQTFLAAAGLTAEPAAGPIAVVRNPHALARAYVVYRTAPAPADDELLRRLADATFDPLALAYVEGDPGFTPAADAPPRGDAARFLEDGEEVVEVEATAAAPGLLVLADTYFTGWHATVDGMPAPIVATDFLFRGVPVPAGTHRVRFVYRPWSILVGQIVSSASTLALALLLVAGRHARR